MNEIIKILKKQTVISLSEASKILGNKMSVYRQVEKGKLSKVYPDGLGYFCLPETEEGTAQFAVITKYYPDCVVSGKTALSLYDLTQDYIDRIDVDIPKSTNIKNELMNVHRVVESKIQGVIERAFEKKDINFKIKIYSPERCLHEAFKIYKGTDSFNYVIMKYCEFYLDRNSPGDQFDEILKHNKKVGRELIDFINLQIGN